jgi:hypothetical protein
MPRAARERLSLGGTARGQRILKTQGHTDHAAFIRGRLAEVGETEAEFLARPVGWKRDKLVRPDREARCCPVTFGEGVAPL